MNQLDWSPPETNPITYSSWTPLERAKVHEWLIRYAKYYAKRFPFFEFFDLYNAGYIGYLEAIRYHTWTIHCAGLTAVVKRIKGAILQEVWKIYGRSTLNYTGYKGKGDYQQEALPLTRSFQQGLKREEIDEFTTTKFGTGKGTPRS